MAYSFVLLERLLVCDSAGGAWQPVVSGAGTTSLAAARAEGANATRSSEVEVGRRWRKSTTAEGDHSEGRPAVSACAAASRATGSAVAAGSPGASLVVAGIRRRGASACTAASTFA